MTTWTVAYLYHRIATSGRKNQIELMYLLIFKVRAIFLKNIIHVKNIYKSHMQKKAINWAGHGGAQLQFQLHTVVAYPVCL